MKRRCKTRGCKSVEKVVEIGGMRFTNFSRDGFCSKCINREMKRS